MDEDENWTRVAAVDDVPEGEPVPVQIGDRQLALYRIGDEWFCTDNVCTHAFALLSDGWLEGHVIECPLHNGQFDIRTGRGLCAPIAEDLQIFPVRVDGDDLLVALP